MKGNLVFMLSQEYSSVDKKDRKVVTSRNAIGMLPAVPFEVVAGKKSRPSPRERQPAK
jgi:hypothetical protein